jgi:BEN domain
MGFGVFLPQAKLSILARATRATQLARMMLEVMFSREEMAVSSVTGRCSNQKPGAVPKQALNPDKVSALLGTVCKALSGF